MKERRRFGSEVEREAREAELVPAGEEDDSAGDALEALLRPPSTFAEDRIYRSIVQRIADEREARQAESGMSAGRANFEGGEQQEQQREGWRARRRGRPGREARQDQVRPVACLNRPVVQAPGHVARAPVGRAPDGGGPGHAWGNAAARDGGRLESLFLYEEDSEDSEETRRAERERLARVLRKGLETDDVSAKYNIERRARNSWPVYASYAEDR